MLASEATTPGDGLSETWDPASIAEGSLFRRRYRVDRHLGRGGMASVWAVYDTQMKRNRALKVNANPHDEDKRARFRAECFLSDVLGQHGGKGFVRALDYDMDDPSWMVMDLVEGATPLGSGFRFDVKRPGALIELLAQLDQAAALLGQAHEMGIVHRDIKPDNLLVDKHGQVFVSDFGIARHDELMRRLQRPKDVHTNTSVGMGTPTYMPLEQFKDAASVGPSADVFALGATLFRLLTGSPPFGDDLESIIVGQRADTVPRPSERLAGWPGELDAVDELCHAALSKAPDARPPIERFRHALAEATSALRREEIPTLTISNVPGTGPAEGAAATEPHGSAGPPAPVASVREGDGDVAEELVSSPRGVGWGWAVVFAAVTSSVVLGMALLVAVLPFFLRSAPTEPCSVVGQLRTPATQMQCCWPGQGWSASRNACVGAPSDCPEGWRPSGDGWASRPPKHLPSWIPHPGVAGGRVGGR